MNKLKIVAKSLAMIVCLLFIDNSASSATYSGDYDALHDTYVPKYSVQDVKERLNNISTVIDVHYTPEVGRRIKEYTVNYRVAGRRILGRVKVFFPLFESEIQKRNLPDALKYVAVVESNLEPTAKSKSGASGLWQFIKSTARMKGLVINEHVDERRDPEKSTAAALEYLNELYDTFDDWTLAMAAYNCGPGNVRKAIRRGGSKDYWKIRSFLPNETQKYVPRVIAAMYLLNYYHVHNLVPADINSDLTNTIKIYDGKGHNMRTLAKKLDVNFQTLASLNPMYKNYIFPKNDGRLGINIPKSTYEKYLSVYDKKAYHRIIEERKQKAELAKKKAKKKIKKKEKLKHIDAIDLLEYNTLLSLEEQRTDISL